MVQLKLTTILDFSIYFFTKVGKNRHGSRIARFSGTKCRYLPSLKRKWGARAFAVTLSNGKMA